VGSPVSFSVDASGDDLTYLWEKVTGGAIDGALTINTKDLNIPSVTTAHAGTYRCLISSIDCGTTYSATVTLTVRENISITSLSDITVCENETNIVFSVTPTGNVTSYVWTDKDGVIAGATGSTYTLPVATSDFDGTAISVTATGSCNSVTQSSVITLNPALTITSHPANSTICNGSTEELSVSHSPLSPAPTYEWFFNGAPQAASNNPTFTASAAGTYYVTLTNSCGTITSNSATLTLMEDFSISTQPTSKTACEGSTVSFTVEAEKISDGTPADVTYQWRKDGVNIAGATTHMLVLNSVATADEALYSCQVSNSCNTIISDGAQLSVSSNTISITSHPTDKIGCIGSPLSLSTVATTASGDALTFTWYKDGVMVGSGSTYSIASFAAADVGTYRCNVSNGCTTQPSSNAVVTQGVVGAAGVPSDLTLCEGQDATFSVGAANPSYTYQWRKDDLNITDDGRIAGANTNQLTIDGVQLTDIATYNCVVTGTCGLPAISNGAELNVEAPPAIDSDKGPNPVTACVGGEATFSVTASGDNLSYRWQKGGVDIDAVANPSAATATLFLSNIQLADAGLYRCVVTNPSCGSVNSTTAELTVLDPIAIVSHPTNKEVCAGSNTTFTFTVTAPAGSTYQWYKGVTALSSSARITGVNLATLNISNLTAADVGSYWCQVLSPCGNTESNPATLTVRSPIAITQHPQSETICSGSSMNLSVIASGDGLGYQWYFDSGSEYNPIAGATSSTYSVAFIPATMEGSYYVEITNTCGTRTSDIATIAAGIATTATISADITRCVGTNANFTVTAGGSNLTYQWYKGADALSDGGNISGSTTTSLNISNVQLADAGIYKCYVVGSCGLVEVDAQLTVNQPITITAQPRDVAVCTGSAANFFVVASGTNPTYEWFKEGDATILSTTSTYTIAAVAAGDAGQYYCEVTNSCGTVTTTKATLSVYGNITIDTDPTDKSICAGGTVSFTLGITGTPVGYQWLKNGQPLTDGGNIAGATTQTLVISNTSATDEAQYSCEVYSGCSTQTSGAAELKVSTPITITQHPQDAIFCSGSSTNLTVFATGDHITYQWWRNGVNLGVGFTDPILNVSDEADYHVIVSNGCGTQTSSVATTTEADITNVTIAGPSPQCEGTDVTFTITPVTGSNLTYQWYKGSTALSNGGQISGVNTSTLTVTGITTANAGSYQCVVTGDCGTQSDLFATLSVQENARITVQPVSTTVKIGNTATLSVVATGTGLNYQWRKDGVDIDATFTDITGFTTSQLVISNAAAGNHDGVYTCVITGTCSSITSANATVNVVATTFITLQPDASVTLCENDVLTLNVEPTSGYTYQWKRGSTTLINDTRISGATSPTLTITGVTVADQGAYTCTVSDGITNEISQASVVTVNPSVSITDNPVDATKCVGESHIFSVTATGDGLTYQWQNSTDGTTWNDVGGATNREYTVNPLSTADAGQYRVLVSGTCGGTPVTQTSSPATLTVNEGITINSDLNATYSVCQNNTISLEFDVTGDNLTFQWYKNGQPVTDGNIVGVTTNRIDINTATLANAGVYSCIVSSPCGSPVTSNLATLTVNPTTIITSQPVSRTKCEGDDITFTVVAQGGNLVYNWTHDGNPVGGDSPTLTLTNLSKASHQGTYLCEVTGDCGTVTSNGAVLTIKANVSITAPAAPTPVPICQGSSTTLSVTALGDDLTYQWTKNGVAITAAETQFEGYNTANLKINSASVADAGVYSCTVTGYCGNPQTSNYYTVTVNPTTAITTQPISRTKCEGDEVVFRVTATGSNLSYQWQKDGVDISGETSATLTLPGLDKTADEGTYRCIVSGDCGTNIQSSEAQLTVNRNTAITARPVIAYPNLCQNGSTTITIVAAGDNLSYEWKKNGLAITGSTFSGVNSSVLEISNAAVADAGDYTCTVTGDCGSALTSSAVTLTVNPTTNITTQPIGRDKCEGDEATLTVYATGNNLAYQWFRGATSLTTGGNISGATTSQLRITNLSTTDAGSYTCQITATCGDITTEPAVVTVSEATAISGDPVIGNATLCQGESTTITISATGDNLTYLWKKNGQPITDANISGINTDVLVISGAQPANEGDYTCTVTGNCGSSRTSNIATLTVYPTTAVTTQPLSATRCEGDQVTFTVSATGSGLSYSWHKNSTANPAITNATLASGAVVTGATTNQLRITGLTSSEAGSYICVVSGTCGANVATIPATLTVNGRIQIDTQPAPLTTLCQGSSVNIEVVALGTVVEYKWKKNGSYISDSGTITGTNSATLSFGNIIPADAGSYTCEIIGTYNTEETQVAQVVVNPTPAITLQPQSTTLCEGNNLQLLVEATGTTPLAYQWKFNNGDISGATSSSLTINNINLSQAGAYSVEVTAASCGSVSSSAANVTVNPKVSISAQPVNTRVCDGTTAQFTVNATGSGTLSYQWVYNNTNTLTDGDPISGATTNQLTIYPATKAHEGLYKCIITSDCGTEETSSVTLSVTDVTAITAHPQDQTVMVNGMANFNVAATGSFNPITYQWQKYNTATNSYEDISGAIAATHNINPVVIADAGKYRCVVTGDCGTVYSNAATLTVNEPVTITTDPVSLPPLCVGDVANFSVTASGTILSYQWQFRTTGSWANLTDINGVSGTGSPNLTISPVGTSHNGSYRCVVTGPTIDITTNSNPATLVVNDVIAITQEPQSQDKCFGDNLVLEVEVTGIGATFAWFKDYAPLTEDIRVTGVTTNRLVIYNITDADAGDYHCVVTNSCDTKNSNVATVNINPVVEITSDPADQVRCVGQTVTFAITSNIPNVTFQWYKGNTPLSNGTLINGKTVVTGATSANLTLTNLQLDDAGNYYCRITDGCTNDNSVFARLTMRSQTAITAEPSNTTVCEGDVAFFEVVATGTNLTYSWYKDNSTTPISNIDGKISGATGNVLSIANVDPADEGTYRCVITGGCTSESTSPASLSVNLYPGTPGTITGLTTVCQGATRVHYMVPEIANAQTYIWDIPYAATIVSGEGTNSILVNYSNTSESGSVTVYGQNGCGNGPASAALPVTVNPLPYAYAGIDQRECSDVFTLDANNIAGGVWSIQAGDAVFPAGQESVHNVAVSNVMFGTNTFRWTVTQNGCSSYDEVNITNLKVAINAGTDQVICSTEATFNAVTPLAGASWRVMPNQGQGTIVDPTSPTSIVTGLSQGVNVLAWQVNNEGCISSDQVSITNNRPLNPDAGPDEVIAFDQYELQAKNPEAGTTGFWDLLSGGGSFDDPTDPNTTIRNLMPGTNVIVWTVTRENCSLTDEVTIENIMLEPANAGSDQTLCVNFTTLAAKAPNIGVGEWSVEVGGGVFADKNSPTTRVTNLAPGVNTLRWTVRTSLIGVTYDEVTIINNMPTPANAGTDRALCTNTVTLAGNSTINPTETGTWSRISGSGVINDFNNPTSPVTNLSPGINEFKWTIDNNGCISNDFVVITNNTPTIAEAGEDQVICTNYTELLPNTPTFGVGSWSIESGNGFISGNTVTNLGPDDNVFVYTITNGTCTSSDKVTITNNKPTTPYAGYDRSICEDNVTLDANQALQGTASWSRVSGSGTITDITNPKTTVTNLSFGPNIFRWTIEKNGCEEFDEVTISNDYVEATAGENQTLCQNFTELRASNPLPGIGTWSILEASAATFVDQNSPNTAVTNLSKGDNRFRWTVTNKNCVATADVTITNNEPTRPNAGEDQAVCGKTTSLNANTASFGTGVWTAMSGAATFTNNADPKTSVSNLAEGRNILRWTITQEDCVLFDEVVITSNFPEDVFAGNDQIVCSNQTTLAANAPTLGSGRWEIVTGSGSFADRFLHNTVVTNLGKGDNIFKWTVSSSDCYDSDLVTIRSSIPTTSVAGASQTLCSETVMLGANTPVEGVGSWTVISGSVDFEDRNDPRTNAINIARGVNIIAWVIDKDGCQSSSELTLTNNLPSVPFAGYDGEICADSITLSAENPEIGVGRWSTFGDATILTSENNHSKAVNLSYGPNTFRWTVTNFNCSLSDDVVITSNLAYVYAGADTTVNTPSVTLIGNVPNVGTGSWSLVAGSQNTQIVTPGNFTSLVNDLTPGVNVFSWNINNNGCISSDEVTITYIVWPDADFEPSTLSGCPPLEVNFVNITSGGEPYRWDMGDGTIINQQHVTYTYFDPGTYSVTLYATAPGSDVPVTKTRSITVHPIPTANFGIAPEVVYMPGQTISCYNYSKNIVQSIWDFGDGRERVEAFAPLYQYQDTGRFNIMLKVINQFGCPDSLTIIDAVHVLKRSEFFFPDAFTPNPFGGSGGVYDPLDRSNDVFYPIVTDGEILDYEFKIFNRAGVMIFRTNDIKLGWDGYYKNKMLPQGVYVYYVTGRYNNGEPFKKVGNVMLIVKDN
jgi:hypothetical protein